MEWFIIACFSIKNKYISVLPADPQSFGIVIFHGLAAGFAPACGYSVHTDQYPAFFLSALQRFPVKIPVNVIPVCTDRPAYLLRMQRHSQSMGRFKQFSFYFPHLQSGAKDFQSFKGGTEFRYPVQLIAEKQMLSSKRSGQRFRLSCM